MVKAENRETSFKTATHKITASNTHKDMWCFENIKTGKGFNITASYDWIVNNIEMIRHPEIKRIRPLMRRSRR